MVRAATICMKAAAAAALLLAAAAQGRAADLDVATGDRPHVIRGVVARQAVADRALKPNPNCRIIPQPQMNLAGEVVRFAPQWVCLSRGLYADTLADQ